MDMGNRIYLLRKSMNMTQEELAEKIGTTKQNIYRYEKGLVDNIPIFRIKKMSDVFGVSPEYLTGWEKKEETPGQLQLTGVEKEILAWFRQVPDENKGAAAKTLRLLGEVPAEHFDMVVDMILVAVSKKQ